MSQNTPKSMNSSWTLEWYVIPRNIWIADRSLRFIWSTWKIVWSTIWSYAIYQSAAYDPSSEEFLIRVAERLTWWIGNTIIDVKYIINDLIENYDSYWKYIFRESATGNVLDRILWTDFSNWWDFEDFETTRQSLSKAIGNTEIDAAKWINNIFNSFKDTIAAGTLVWISLWVMNRFIFDMIFLRDKPDFSHRIRCRVRNICRLNRSKSRKINLPKTWGDKFTRI